MLLAVRVDGLAPNWAGVEVVRWLVEVGDQVDFGSPLVELRVAEFFTTDRAQSAGHLYQEADEVRTVDYIRGTRPGTGEFVIVTLDAGAVVRLDVRPGQRVAQGDVLGLLETAPGTAPGPVDLETVDATTLPAVRTDIDLDTWEAERPW